MTPWSSTNPPTESRPSVQPHCRRAQLPFQIKVSQSVTPNLGAAQSIARGNGLVGIYISGIKDQKGNTDAQGPAPSRLLTAGVSCQYWDRSKFGEWVEAALKKAHPNG